MIDHTQVRLGKRAARHDVRTLRLSRYLSADRLPSAPAACDWTHSQQDWSMMLNDRLGCCTIAGIAHQIQVWTQVINQEITVGDDVVLKYYTDWDGYVDGDFRTDNGGVELDVLNNWRKAGFNGHELTGYAAVGVANFERVKQAIALFGGLYIGVALPLTAQRQEVWDTGGEPGSWGGHCVCVPYYDENGLVCITWGKLQRMTWAFWAKYVDEAYALISPDFITRNGKAPSDFDLDTLVSDLQEITA